MRCLATNHELSYSLGVYHMLASILLSKLRVYPLGYKKD